MLVLNIKGLKELSVALNELSPRIARNALRQSVSRGAAVIRDEAQQRAPVAESGLSPGQPPPGTLRRSIVIKQDRAKSSLVQQTYVVAVRHGKRYRNQGKRGNLSQDAYYWRWIEFGTVKMSARPFMRAAFEAKKVAAVQAIAQSLSVRIAQEAALLARTTP